MPENSELKFVYKCTCGHVNDTGVKVKANEAMTIKFFKNGDDKDNTMVKFKCGSCQRIFSMGLIDSK